MVTTTSRRAKTWLRESANVSSSRVDATAGVIRRVKLLGGKSSNGRVYTRACLEGAVRLYEGVMVNADHPNDPDDQRSCEDRLGRIVNVRLEDGGLYGDLVLLKSHPMAERLLEAARDPLKEKMYGLSHNANGSTSRDGNTLVVHEILEVRSVDIVADPATTRGLFESVQRRKNTMTKKKTMKLREWIERTKLLKGTRKRVLSLMEGYLDKSVMEDDLATDEAGLPPTDTEPESANPPEGMDPADMSPEDALRQGFRTACVAVLDDNTLDAKAKCARLKELITTGERLMAAGEEIPEAADEEEEEAHEEPDGDELPLKEGDGDEDDKPCLEGEGEEDEDEDVLESKQKKTPKLSDRQRLKAAETELSKLRRERDVVALCESEGITRPSKTLVKALCLLEGEDRKQMISEHKSLAASSKKARSATVLTEGRQTTTTTSDADDLDGFLKKITTASSNGRN